MKTLKTLIAAALLVSTTSIAFAQVEEKDDSKTINLTANLNTTIALNLDQSGIVFDFTTLDHYKDGLGAYKGNYSSKGSVSSTTNWELFFNATQPFTHTDNQSTMPLNNVGITASVDGSGISTNGDNGNDKEKTNNGNHNGHDNGKSKHYGYDKDKNDDESSTTSHSIENYADGQTLALSMAEKRVLGRKGSEMNAGDHDDNKFTIYWEMGTKNEGMNQKSIFAQDLKKGSYNTDVQFTAREIL